MCEHIHMLSICVFRKHATSRYSTIIRSAKRPNIPTFGIFTRNRKAPIGSPKKCNSSGMSTTGRSSMTASAILLRMCSRFLPPPTASSTRISSSDSAPKSRRPRRAASTASNWWSKTFTAKCIRGLLSHSSSIQMSSEFFGQSFRAAQSQHLQVQDVSCDRKFRLHKEESRLGAAMDQRRSRIVWRATRRVRRRRRHLLQRQLRVDFFGSRVAAWCPACARATSSSRETK